MAFVRLGPSLVEVVQCEAPTRIWGLVAVVEDFSELPADLIGEPRDAVQPGRRIVTVRPEAGLETAVAFMTPRPRSSRSFATATASTPPPTASHSSSSRGFEPGWGRLDKRLTARYLRRLMFVSMFHAVVTEPVAKTGATARGWNTQPIQATS